MVIAALFIIAQLETIQIPINRRTNKLYIKEYYISMRMTKVQPYTIKINL